MSITGIPGQGPVRVGIPIADLCSGIFLAQGILVALIERESTGEGKWVHTSLLEAMLSMLDFQASRWLMSHEVPPQAGGNHPTGIPTGVFETKDGHINIAAAGDDIYARLCRAIEQPDRTIHAFRPQGALDEPRRHHGSPHAGDPAEDQRRVDHAAQRRRRTVRSDLQDQRVVRRSAGAAPGDGAAVRSPALGELTILGHPVSHGEKRLPLRSAAPELGDANDEMLTTLGYTKEQIADLAKRGVI